jgi:hypothetical protein
VTKKTAYEFVVRVTVPDTSDRPPDDGVRWGYKPNRKEVRSFIRDAVNSWGGQYHPDTPFFPRNGFKATVK